MRIPLGAIESPDGGTWHVVFTEAQKLDGWTFHPGMTSVPGPDEQQMEIDSRIREEAIQIAIEAIPPERIAEITAEVIDARKVATQPEVVDD